MSVTAWGAEISEEWTDPSWYGPYVLAELDFNSPHLDIFRGIEKSLQEQAGNEVDEQYLLHLDDSFYTVLKDTRFYNSRVFVLKMRGYPLDSVIILSDNKPVMPPKTVYECAMEGECAP